MDNNQAAMTDSEIKLYKGLKFWLSFAGVFAYILCGLLGLTSLILIISVVGIFAAVPFYIPLAVVYFFLGKWLFQAAGSFGGLEVASDYRVQALDGLTAIRNIFKTLGILTIVSIVLSVITTILFFIVGIAFLAETDFDIDDTEVDPITTLEREI